MVSSGPITSYVDSGMFFFFPYTSLHFICVVFISSAIWLPNHSESWTSAQLATGSPQASFSQAEPLSSLSCSSLGVFRVQSLKMHRGPCKHQQLQSYHGTEPARHFRYKEIMETWFRGVNHLICAAKTLLIKCDDSLGVNNMCAISVISTMFILKNGVYSFHCLSSSFKAEQKLFCAAQSWA